MRGGGCGGRLARASPRALRLGQRHPAGRGGVDRRSAGRPAEAAAGQVFWRPAGDRRRHGAGARGAERADGRRHRPYGRPDLSPRLAGFAHPARRRRGCGSRRHLQRTDRRRRLCARRAGAAVRDPDCNCRDRRILDGDPDLAADARAGPGFPRRGASSGRYRAAPLCRRRDLAVLHRSGCRRRARRRRLQPHLARHGRHGRTA